MNNIIIIGGLDANTNMTDIEKEIIKSSRHTQPKILYIPTAGGDSLRNYQLAKDVFLKDHGCKVEPLLLIDQDYTYEELKKRILESDVIFVGGGNVSRLMTYIKRHKLDEIFKEALSQGIVLSGMSGGGLFYGVEYLETGEVNRVIECLKFLNLTICPHYHKESYQGEVQAFEEYILSNNLIGIGIDNNCALQIKDNKYRIISSLENAKAYKIYKSNNQIVREILLPSEEYKSLIELEQKSL